MQSTARAYVVADLQVLMFLKSGWIYISFHFSVQKFSYYFQWSLFSFFFSFLPFQLLQCFVSHLICKNFIYIYLKCAILLLLSEVCLVSCSNYFSVRLHCQQLLPHSCQLKHKCYRLLFLKKQFKM